MDQGLSSRPGMGRAARGSLTIDDNVCLSWLILARLGDSTDEWSHLSSLW